MRGLIELLVFFGSWIPAVLAFFAVLVGLVGAPVGGVLCMLAAGPRGRNRLYYACIGVVYTALFVVPVFYLLSRLRGRSFPTEGVLLSYGIVYLTATSCIAFYFVVLPPYIDYTTSIVVPIVMALVTLVSLSMVTSFYRLILLGHLPHYIYVVPFIALYVSTITVWYMFFRGSQHYDFY